LEPPLPLERSLPRDAITDDGDLCKHLQTWVLILRCTIIIIIIIIIIITIIIIIIITSTVSRGR
jgi:hypothetical protein